MESDMSREEIGKFIQDAKWVFAKTMKETPHEYANRKTMNPEMKKEFDRFVIFIRDNGEKASFWKKMYIYFLFDGWYYWTMGDPVSETFILNRASIETSRIINGRMVIHV